MTTDDQTQLDRIERKLDQVLKQVTPTEIVTDFKVSTVRPRRRWWRRRGYYTETGLEEAMRQLEQEGLL